MDLAQPVAILFLIYTLASISDTFSEETTELHKIIQASAHETESSFSTDLQHGTKIKDGVIITGASRYSKFSFNLGNYWHPWLQ